MPPLSNGINTPLIIESRRVSPTSVFVSWGPYSGTDQFIVQYGFENGNWLYSTNVTGFSTTINGLPPNQPVWVRVAARNNCSIGVYGEARLVGGPLLPNTGINQNDKSIIWDVALLASIVMLVSTSLIVVSSKRTV